MIYKFAITIISIQNKKRATCLGSSLMLAHLDSNQERQNQNLLCYRYTMGHRLGKMFLFVGPPGFEPRKTEPKSVVLPLHHGPFFLRGTKLH